MELKRLNLDSARFTGLNYDIIGVQYIGIAEEFDEFCKFLYFNMPNVQYLRVTNPKITTIMPVILRRLRQLECPGTAINRIKDGTDLRRLIATDTPLELISVLYDCEHLEYVKLGSVSEGTRQTIDSAKEYSEFRSHYVK